MGVITGRAKWVLAPCALVAAVYVSFAVHDAVAEANPFLTTTSPSGAYTVNLTGRKDRPFLTPNTVSYHALKGGEPFLRGAGLHKTWDFMDPWFELMYPDHRWVSDNALQLYNGRLFHGREPDTLIVVNRAGRAVKHLRVASGDQILLFDIEPGSETRLPSSPARGESKSFYVSGEFYDGRRLEAGAVVRVSKLVGGAHTYYLQVSVDGVTVTGPH